MKKIVSAILLHKDVSNKPTGCSYDLRIKQDDKSPTVKLAIHTDRIYSLFIKNTLYVRYRFLKENGYHKFGIISPVSIPSGSGILLQFGCGQPQRNTRSLCRP